MKTTKMPRDSSLDPRDDVKKQLETSYCNLLKTDEESGSKLYKIVYGFIIYNGFKNELWKIDAEVCPIIEDLHKVREYAEIQFERLIKKS